MKSKHSKVQNIKYTELTEQHYLKSILFSNEDANLLFSLRTKTSKYFKSNFPNMEKSCLHCPLRCWGVDEVPILDTQEHILLCKRLSNLKSSEVTTEKVEYSFLFGEIKKQKEIVTLIKLLLEEKQILCPPGDKLDPSTVQGLCCSSNWFWYYICYYLGFKNKKRNVSFVSKADSQHHSLWEVYVSTDVELLKYEMFSKKVAHITIKCTFAILSKFQLWFYNSKFLEITMFQLTRNCRSWIRFQHKTA